MRKAVLFTAAALAGGCVPVQAEENAQAPAASEPAAAKCDAGKASTLVGRTSTPELVEEAKRLTGARAVRVIRFGDMVTMDYREDRLNLRLDAEGRVERADCG